MHRLHHFRSQRQLASIRFRVHISHILRETGLSSESADDYKDVNLSSSFKLDLAEAS
jgi:hypothetical protein